MALKILLAENNITVQKMGMNILTAAGHDVVTVSNGLAAIKSMTQSHPDVLLLDVYLPGYSGIEICEKVKAAPEMAHVSVLLTAGKIQPFRAEESIGAKADGFITKPFEAGELIATIEKLVERAHPETLETIERVDQLPARSRLTAAVPSVQNSDVAASAGTSGSKSLLRQGEELCDVCGYVNRDHAFACRICDVPLPSSVMSAYAKAN